MTDMLAPLGDLAEFAGRWVGVGEGHYPTIDSFSYREEIEFSPSGKPFLAYRSRTWNAVTGQPMHTECGYLRQTASGFTELLVSQPIGLGEIYRARLEDGSLDFETATPTRSPEAKPVHEIRRRVVRRGDLLTYDMWMAHAETPLTHHLHAELRRATAS
ncbi:hypothetical protein AS9A_3600 [Hoyosella subflava DQS3-9A1]|uniref:THAP4-like heme-binding domain-containing protein n=2 Tax=Hoyosella TaxID=697025 RepID=F6ES34_HOYSD|nr:hypothetical protein AS9A_3600 [Hoyosella subflava DQS3-9A1]